MIPEAETMLTKRIYYFHSRGNGRRWAYREFPMDLFVEFDRNDLANLADVADVELGEDEIPLTDDGF